MKRDNLITKERIFLLISLLAIMIVGLFWGTQKQGMFLDEIYTYGLSNGYYTPFPYNIPEDGDLVNKTFTQDELQDYLSVQKDDAFQFDSVYYNQTQDVHPPLYYMIFHFVSSVFQGKYSKWIGLGINLILYLCMGLILYKLGELIFKNKTASVWTVLVYGLSWGGLSTMLMIRMYTLLTLLTVVFAYFVIRLYEKEKEKIIFYPLVGLTLFLGMLTQYYFVIFAFFLSAVYCLNKLKKRKFKQVAGYAVSAGAGLLCFYLVWPAVTKHLTSDGYVSGKSAMQNFYDVGHMLERIRTFLLGMKDANKLILLVAAVFFIILIIQLKSTVKRWARSFNEKDSAAIALAVAVLLTIILVAVISPYLVVRYVYNILPIFILVIIYFIEAVLCNTEFLINIRERLQDKRYMIPLYVIAVFVVVVSAFAQKPDYIYPEKKEYNRIVEEYKKLPCVYMSENLNPTITQDLLQITKFKSVYVTNDFLQRGTENYLKDFGKSNKVILYIDVAQLGGSGFDPKKVMDSILSNTKYSKYQYLYSNGRSQTYLLKR